MALLSQEEQIPGEKHKLKRVAAKLVTGLSCPIYHKRVDILGEVLEQYKKAGYFVQQSERQKGLYEVR